MKKVILHFFFAAVLLLSSCVLAHKAAVNFYNATGIYHLNFTLDGAAHPSNPVPSGVWVEWAAITPGDHMLGATAADSTGAPVPGIAPVSELMNLKAGTLTTWTITTSGSALFH